MRVVYRNYRTPFGEVKRNPFETRARNSKRGFKLQKQKKNSGKDGGRYYPCHKKVKNHYIF